MEYSFLSSTTCLRHRWSSATATQLSQNGQRSGGAFGDAQDLLPTAVHIIETQPTRISEVVDRDQVAVTVIVPSGGHAHWAIVQIASRISTSL